jgi:hypothetical protein
MGLRKGSSGVGWGRGLWAGPACLRFKLTCLPITAHYFRLELDDGGAECRGYLCERPGIV